MLIKSFLAELRDTESAHKQATLELEQMKEMMDRMEEERAEMVAEVEAQIERALTSMAVDLDESDYGSSRPVSRLSNISGTRSRRASDAAKSRHLRSFATESTLAESYGESIEALESEGLGHSEKSTRLTDTIVEDEEEEPAARRKRFSASDMDVPQDGMNAVDEGISQRSDKIAQKVLEIQQKVSLPPTLLSKLAKRILQLESAMASERRAPKYRARSAYGSGEEEISEVDSTQSRHSRSRRGYSKHGSKPPSRPRTRSGTTSSTQTSTPTVKSNANETPSSLQVSKSLNTISIQQDAQTPTHSSFLDVSGDDTSTPELVASPVTTETPSEEVATPTNKPTVPVGLTDDSDTDFQSAYSTSPRQSYGSFEEKHSLGGVITDNAVVADGNIEDRLSAPPRMRRERVSSTSTAMPVTWAD